MSGGRKAKMGTPQGGVISPLLANRYMNRYLKFWKQSGCEQRFQAKLVNYADDFVILSRGKASQALAWTRQVMKRLHLEVNETKTCVRKARQERFDFLTTQVADLEAAEAELREAIRDLKKLIRERFVETFHVVNERFSFYFTRFFGGGQAELRLLELVLALPRSHQSRRSNQSLDHPCGSLAKWHVPRNLRAPRRVHCASHDRVP